MENELILGVFLLLVIIYFRRQYHAWLRKRDWWKWYGRVYLKSFHWRWYRRVRLAFAGWRCEYCGSSEKPLQAHHLNYKHLWNESMKDTMIACKKCHEEEHGRKF